jgi:hypothetical protein
LTLVPKLIRGEYPACYPVGAVVLSSGYMRPGYEGDNSVPPSADFKKCSYPSCPTYILVAWHLLNHRDRLTMFSQFSIF